MHVNDANDPKTFLYFESEAGDTMGQGQTRLFTSEDFVISGNGASNLVFLQAQGAETWQASFYAPPGQDLLAGTYSDAVLPGAQGTMRAGLSFADGFEIGDQGRERSEEIALLG